LIGAWLEAPRVVIDLGSINTLCRGDGAAPVNELVTKERLQKRLAELRAEQENGRRLLGDLEAKATELRATILRITGAIQVIEEMLAQGDGAGETGEERAPG